jgi:hypothetical protein
MFKWLCDWFNGELIEVEIYDTRREQDGWAFQHTVVTLPNRERRYVMGHVGKSGEKIVVNTWDLRKFH